MAGQHVTIDFAGVTDRQQDGVGRVLEPDLDDAVGIAML